MNHEKHKSHIMTLTGGSRRKTLHFFEFGRGGSMDPPGLFLGRYRIFFYPGVKNGTFLWGTREKYKKGPAADPALTDYGPNAPRG